MKVAVLVIAVALTQCHEKRQPVASDCAVIKELLYPNCRFKLSPGEIAALSPENKDKLTAVKLFFRQCPQAKECITAPR